MSVYNMNVFQQSKATDIGLKSKHCGDTLTMKLAAYSSIACFAMQCIIHAFSLLTRKH